MAIIHRLEVFKNLMADATFVRSSEESIIGNALIKEQWHVATPYEKQAERRQFVASGKKSRSVINLVYYENMIKVYDLIIEMLEKIEKILTKQEEGKPVDISIMRIAGLILVEQGFIDEYILPYHHIPPLFFQNIAKELHSDYPNLNLIEFSEQYNKMYDLWPEKSNYVIQKIDRK